MNKVILTGNLVFDPELKQVGESSLCNFRVAVRKPHAVKEGEPTADFFTCTAWGKEATFLAEYGGKGRSVALEGRLQTREYTDKDGNQRYVTDIVANRVEFLDSRKEETNGETKSERPVQTRKSSAPKTSYAESDDELPF